MSVLFSVGRVKVDLSSSSDYTVCWRLGASNNTDLIKATVETSGSDKTIRITNEGNETANTLSVYVQKAV